MLIRFVDARASIAASCNSRNSSKRSSQRPPPLIIREASIWTCNEGLFSCAYLAMSSDPVFADQFAEAVAPELQTLIEARVSAATASLLQETVALEQRLGLVTASKLKATSEAEAQRQIDADKLEEVKAQLAARRSTADKSSSSKRLRAGDDADVDMLRLQLATAAAKGRREDILLQDLKARLQETEEERERLVQTVALLTADVASQKPSSAGVDEKIEN